MSPIPIARVSVLLPAYNAAATLWDAAQSILSQTQQALELLLYDDGSRDGTAQVMERLKEIDPRVRVVGSERVGLVEALRRLAAAATTELLARMDADDFSHPTRLEQQLALLDERPHLDVVGTRVRCVPEELVADGMRTYIEWMNSLVEPQEHDTDMFIESPLCHPSVVMRRRAYEAVGGYLDDGRPEDYGLWLRLYRAGARFAKVPQVLVDWTESQGRLTRTDGRYAPMRFVELKLSALLDGPLADKKTVCIWGAGPTGKTWGRALSQSGLEIAAWLDVDPAKIGRQRHGSPVLSYEVLRQGLPGQYLLVAVGSRAPREKIRAFLASIGLQEPRDYRTVS